MEAKKNISRQIITFFIITSVITAGVFIWIFNSSEVDTGMIFVMMWAPGISAIITSFAFRDKIKNYGWKFGKLRFQGYSYILPIIASIIAYGLVWLSGLGVFSTETFGNTQWAQMLGIEGSVSFGLSLLLRMTTGFLIASIFVLGEEIGWSGFLTPKLSQVTSLTVTSIVVGAYWAIWHFPAIIGGFYGYGMPLWISLPGFTLVLIGASFLRTILRSRSGSLWTGVVLHTSHNMFLMGAFKGLTVDKGYTFYFVSETGIFLGIIYIVTALLFIKYTK